MSNFENVVGLLFLNLIFDYLLFLLRLFDGAILLLDFDIVLYDFYMQTIGSVYQRIQEGALSAPRIANDQYEIRIPNLLQALEAFRQHFVNRCQRDFHLSNIILRQQIIVHWVRFHFVIISIKTQIIIFI